MLLQQLGFGFSSQSSERDQRHCYVRASKLAELLETPGVLESLLAELARVDAPGRLSHREQLDCLRRSVIHLSVTRSPFTGMSVEEIVVLAAYASERFNHTSWKDEITWQPTERHLLATCEGWLLERVAAARAGNLLGQPGWPFVGYTPEARQDAGRLVLGLAPIASAAALPRELERLAAEAGFAHEHYVACTPATALEYLSREANSAGALRWDAFALDRRLRSLGLGLLLVERAGVHLYLPARYDPTPRSLPWIGRPPPGQ